MLNNGVKLKFKLNKRLKIYWIDYLIFMLKDIK